METLDPIAEFLTARLVGLDPLVGSEVHAEALDETATYPAILFTVYSSPKVLSNGGGVLAADPLYRVTVHGRNDILSPAALAAIAARIGPALDTTELGAFQVGDYLVECWEDPRGDYRDAEFEDGVRYDCIGGYYRLFIQEGTGGRSLHVDADRAAMHRAWLNSHVLFEGQSSDLLSLWPFAMSG